MKYTKANIKGVPLFVVNKETGIMYKGAFNNDNGVFDVTNDTKTTYIIFNLNELLSYNRIDDSYKNRKDIHEKYFIIHTSLEFGVLCDGNGKSPFLIFSSEEKANYVLKHFVIPPLINERVSKADELMTQYLDFTKDVNRLENQLKDL